MSHWSDAYVGRPFVKDEYVCGHLAADVLREVFGVHVDIPTAKAKAPGADSRAIRAEFENHATRLDTPVEGCVVLMRKGNLARPWHVGVFFFAACEGWVLHTMANTGAAVTSRVRDLPRIGFQIEGYYAWQ